MKIGDNEWTPEEFQEAVEGLIEDCAYHLSMYDTSSSRTNAGYHLTELFDKMAQLKTWHRGYDYNTGTLPWEREDDD